MKIYYYIKTDGDWKRVSYDEYQAFEGKKETRSPTYGLALLQKYLEPYRW